jgi:1-acyl-sn-glycerol-3-phosphate acyltransferase
VRPNGFYRFVGAISWPVMHGLFRFRAEGVENLPPTGGFVLAANHASNMDPWPLAMALWPQRWLRFMAKSELYWWPLKVVLDAGGCFPVRRGTRDVEALRTAIELARGGGVIAMFPEGTRRKKGLRKKHQPHAHTGAARIAIEAGVPLVPAAILGTDRLARLGPLRVRYAPPIPIDDVQGRDRSAAAREATELLMAEIARLEQGG